MPKFSQVVAGTRARKTVHLPLPGAQIDALTGQWLGPTERLDVRPIREDEYATILGQAAAFAKKHGIEAPSPDEPLFERGKMLHTLAIACIDHESPVDNPQPFFDGGAEQIARSEIMTPEVVGYLYLQQELFQDETNPLRGDMNPDEFLAATLKTAEGDASFFVNSRPGVLWTFTRTLASQLVASLARSSSSSSPSGPPPIQ